MQKMWAITAITLVGFMMIISSIPQDAFAGKDTVKISLNITNDGERAKGVNCGAGTDGTTFDQTDNSAKSAKVTFHFDKTVTSVFVLCDGGNIIEFNLVGKNTRATYDLNDEPSG